jgi:acyl-CoA-binding protein
MKRVYAWHKLPIEETCYGNRHGLFGVYRIDSWEVWPDLEGATKEEVQRCIDIWKSHGYLAPMEWTNFIKCKPKP